VLVTIYDEKLIAGSFESPIKETQSHSGLLHFTDPHGRQYGFGENKGSDGKFTDTLYALPNKETVAEGHVAISKPEVRVPPR
jgi:hypothetical protein